MTDELGNRIKSYEKQTDQRLIPRLPFVVRIDGCGFSRFTKGFPYPYDPELRDAMIGGCKAIIENTHAVIGYTQSDEASFIFEEQDQLFMGGRVSKICSEFPQIFLWGFLSNAVKRIKDKAITRQIRFDCRVFNVPNRMEAVNSLVWREQDATKNSIQMLARNHFSHKQLDGVNTKRMQDMLMEQRGVNWNDCDVNFKRGTYLRRVTFQKTFSLDEIAGLPANHNARKNPNMVFTRSKINVLTVPPITKVANKIEFVFDNESPRTY